LGGIGSAPGDLLIARNPEPEFVAAEIRASAVDMGHPVSDRGRIPAELVQAFRDRATTPAGCAAGPGET
jgi:predicted RNA-binding protein YlqC (UPF0109 family)